MPRMQSVQPRRGRAGDVRARPRSRRSTPSASSATEADSRPTTGAADDRYALRGGGAARGGRQARRAARAALTQAREPPRGRTGEPGAPSGGGNGAPYRSEDGATLGRDFNIPGVDPEDDDPYRWHTGEKRDHGGEDAIEIIDLVKQFGRARILNGLNLGLPDDQISMVLGPSGTGKSC